MIKLKHILWAVAILSIGVSCGGNKDFLVIIHTPYGDMKAVLYDETPQHKANFLKLAKEGKYDSTIFHRVINRFMIQGGDVNLNKPQNEKIAEYTVPGEFVPQYFHVKGALSAARQGDNVNPQKASSGTQFYIVQGQVYESEDALTMDQEKLQQAITKLLQDTAYTYVKDNLTRVYIEARNSNSYEAYAAEIQKIIPLIKEKVTTDLYQAKTFAPERIEAYTTKGGAPHLDDEYTVFGRVVEGLEVIDKIAALQTRGERPIENVYMTVEITEVPKKELTEKYGIKYND